MTQNQLKQALLAGAAAFNVTVPAFAGGFPEGINPAPEQLTMAEMEATTGAQGPVGAIIGGTLGGGAYAIQHAFTGQFSPAGLVANVAGGAVVGAVFPPHAQAVRFTWAVNGAMARGVAQGTVMAQSQNDKPNR